MLGGQAAKGRHFRWEGRPLAGHYFSTMPAYNQMGPRYQEK
jgi:hypothetical protein